MRIERLAMEFEERGFVYLEGVFAPELMDRLQSLIEKWYAVDHATELDGAFSAAARTEVAPWFPRRHDVHAFDVLDGEPLLRDLTARVLGAEWQSQYCMVMQSKAGSAGQAWHQDCPPEHASMFNLNRLIYSADILEENGGQICIMPGSHRRGELPAGDPHESLSGEIILSPRKGDLIFLHGHCWHRVLPITHRDRYSINCRAAPRGAPDDLTDICVYRNMRYQFSTQRILVQRHA